MYYFKYDKLPYFEHLVVYLFPSFTVLSSIFSLPASILLCENKGTAVDLSPYGYAPTPKIGRLADSEQYQTRPCPASSNTPYSTHCLLQVPCIIAIPMLARCLQCLQLFKNGHKPVHLLNALKYCLALVVVLLGARHPMFSPQKNISLMVLSVSSPHSSSPTVGEPKAAFSANSLSWLICSTVLALLSALWDCKVDWGLFSGGHSSRHHLLRPHIMFYRPWIYYLVMGLNVPLRFVWCLSFTPFDWRSDAQSYLLPVVLLLEVARRTAWGILIVENMHVQGHQVTTHSKRGDMPLFFDTNESDDDSSENRRATGTVMSDIGLWCLIILILGLLQSLASLWIPV